jgi:hypothetical protein
MKEKETTPSSITFDDQLRLDVRKLDERKGGGAHFAIYGNVKVVIDWKHTDVEHVTGIGKLTFTKRIRDLAELLGVRKPQEFCTMQLLGYIDESPTRYGFVFNLPIEANPELQCESLYELFHRKDYLPSLSDRFKLAEQLASALYLFHSAGWLHKGLTSKHVLFFTPTDAIPNEETTTINLLERPYLVGFEYSRMQTTPQYSDKPPQNPDEDVYRHPDGQESMSRKTPFKPLYDVYSLGVIFLELAYWRRVTSILKTCRGRDVKTFDNNDLKAVQSWLLELMASNNASFNIRFKVGAVFDKVVRWCLSSEFKTDTHEYSQGLQDVFMEEVILRLKDCRL